MLMKIDKIVKSWELENTYDQFSESGTQQLVNTAQIDVNQNQYSLQSYTLIERLKALEVHINSISNLFEDKELKAKVKQKRKQTQPSPSLKSNKGSPR